VTLNITVAHPQCIYVAADFRLFDVAKRQPITEPSMKVVQVAYEGGVNGLITYTGIGGAAGKYTADFICEWLTGMRDLDLDDVAEVLRSKGSSWLRGLRQPKIPGHTFVIAGYDRAGDPRIYVVSNFQTADGRSDTSVATALKTTTLTARTARVLVTGVPGAVRRDRRKHLARTVDAMPLDSARIKASMLRLIEEAAISTGRNTSAQKAEQFPSCQRALGVSACRSRATSKRTRSGTVPFTQISGRYLKILA
jgi:hypothetical protein